MPETTPHPPGNQPWQNGWVPDTSRAPGTRRLWLAGGLAIATIVACTTAIVVNRQAPDDTASPVRSAAPTDDGPGLLSFASPSSGTTPAPKGKTGMSSVMPPAASATATDGDGEPKSTASASPSKSPASHGGSGGSDGSGGSGDSGGSDSSSVWSSVRSVNYPDRYWHLSGGYVRLDPIGSVSARRDATFKVVGGLADGSCYSFATADGGYLRHRNFLLRAERNDGSSLFRQDATFCPRASAYSGAVMLESVNYPGRFLRHQNFRLKLDPYQYGDLYRADSAFRLVDGLA
ncbi:AbfB domain-containing protein [Streptomyces sp. NPDC050625]|uniref:AbfB domain-containing protein n=1 Tax=Streptomyces sp. NPDC050625 TaxID=3154629 RepID=UPI003431467B